MQSLFNYHGLSSSLVFSVLKLKILREHLQSTEEYDKQHSAFSYPAFSYAGAKCSGSAHPWITARPHDLTLQLLGQLLQ